MSSQSSHPSVLTAGLIGLLGFAATSTAGFLAFAFFRMPPHWLGTMDGYFYGLMIKSYLNGFSFTALDMKSPLDYPPYFFYALGTLGKIFHIADLGWLQLFGFIIAYATFPLATYFILKPAMTSRLTVLAIIAMFMLSALSTGGQNIWLKCHEIMALICIPAFAAYLHAISRSTFTTRRHRIVCGLGIGFSIGSYTTLAVVPVIAVALIVGGVFVVSSREQWRKKLHFILDPWLLAPAFFLALPYLVVCLLITLTHDRGLGVVTWFPESDLHYIIAHPRWGNIVFYIAGGWGLYTLIRQVRQKDVTLLPIFFALLVFLSAAAYGALVTAERHGIYFSSPFKYYLSIPFALALLIASWPATDKIMDRIFCRTSPRAATATAVTVGSVAAIVVLAYIWFLPQAQGDFQIAVSRRALKPLITYVEDARKTQNLTHYIGGGEATYLNYYVKGVFTNDILFNESYTSVYEHLMDRVAQLNDAAYKGADALYRQLKDDHVDILLLEPVDAKGFYNINVMYNKGKDMGLNATIALPEASLKSMIAANQASYKKVADYDIYVLK